MYILILFILIQYNKINIKHIKICYFFSCFMIIFHLHILCIYKFIKHCKNCINIVLIENNSLDK